MSDQEYQEYVEHQQKFYDVDEQTETKKLTQLTLVYEQLQKDYQKVKQEIVYERTLRTQAEKKCEETEKTLNDVIIHTEAKTAQLKKTVIEVPINTLYSMAFDWQTKPQSVFVVYDEETEEVSLKTAEELTPDIKKTYVDGREKYRHWWLR